MPKFEVGKKYRYTGPLDIALDFIEIGIDSEDAEYIVSGEPLTVEFPKSVNRIKFKEFKNSWAFLSNMLEKFEEVPAPSSEIDWKKKYAKMMQRYEAGE